MPRTTPIPCPVCRYDLRGLAGSAGATCPECGSRLDDTQLRNYATFAARLWLPIILLAPIVNLTVGAAVIFALITAPQLRLHAALIAGFLASLAWCLHAERGRRAHMPTPATPDRKSLRSGFTRAIASLIALAAFLPAATLLWCLHNFLTP